MISWMFIVIQNCLLIYAVRTKSKVAVASANIEIFAAVNVAAPMALREIISKPIRLAPTFRRQFMDNPSEEIVHRTLNHYSLISFKDAYWSLSTKEREEFHQQWLNGLDRKSTRLN